MESIMHTLGRERNACAHVHFIFNETGLQYWHPFYIIRDSFLVIKRLRNVYKLNNFEEYKIKF